MATVDDLKALDNAQRELEEQRDRMNHALRMSEELKHINNGVKRKRIYAQENGRRNRGFRSKETTDAVGSCTCS